MQGLDLSNEYVTVAEGELELVYEYEYLEKSNMLFALAPVDELRLVVSP